MKFAAAVAAMLAMLAVPAWAQRGSAHGGFSGHAGGGAHAGFAPRGGFGAGFAPHSSGFAPRFGGFAPRTGFAPRRFMGPARAFSSGAGAFRNYGYDRGRHYGGGHYRPPYRRGFGGYSYGYAYPVWPGYPVDLDPWLFGPDWSDSSDDQNAAPQPDYGQNAPVPYPNYGEPAPEGYPQSAPPPYPNYQAENTPPPAQSSPRPPYTGGSAHSASAGPQPAVTIVFKNGRAPEKIRNYMLTANALTVLDAHYEQIPIDQIDIPATEAANREDGINFQIPPTGQ